MLKDIYLHPIFTILFCCFCSFTVPLAQSATLEKHLQAGSFLYYVPTPMAFQPLLRQTATNLRRGALLMNAGNKAEATKVFHHSLSRLKTLLQKSTRGYHDELYQLQGYAYEQLGRNQEALQSYEKSLKQKASNATVLFRYGLVLKRTGQCEKALKEFKEILWMTKVNSHEVMFITADCLLLMGRKEEAFKLAESAHKKNPLFLPIIHQLLALRREMLLKERNPSRQLLLKNQIAAYLSVISSQDPNDKEAALEFAEILLKKSDPLLQTSKIKQAEKLARNFAEGSNYDDTQSVRLLFDALLKLGKLDEAESILLKGLRRHPQSPLLLEAQKQLQITRGISP